MDLYLQKASNSLFPLSQQQRTALGPGRTTTLPTTRLSKNSGLAPSDKLAELRGSLATGTNCTVQEGLGKTPKAASAMALVIQSVSDLMRNSPLGTMLRQERSQSKRMTPPPQLASPQISCLRRRSVSGFLVESSRLLILGKRASLVLLMWQSLIGACIRKQGVQPRQEISLLCWSMWIFCPHPIFLLIFCTSLLASLSWSALNSSMFCWTANMISFHLPSLKQSSLSAMYSAREILRFDTFSLQRQYIAWRRGLVSYSWTKCWQPRSVSFYLICALRLLPTYSQTLSRVWQSERSLVYCLSEQGQYQILALAKLRILVSLVLTRGGSRQLCLAVIPSSSFTLWFWYSKEKSSSCREDALESSLPKKLNAVLICWFYLLLNKSNICWFGLQSPERIAWQFSDYLGSVGSLCRREDGQGRQYATPLSVL